MDLIDQFIYNFTHNLFKPILLFFYLGFLIPILKVPLEFPPALYKALTIYLLIAIGWHGGEELAELTPDNLQDAVGFMIIGFTSNFIIGVAAYYALRNMTRLRKIDAATVAGYYGSDSAGTYVTAVGVLVTANIAYAAYMPVMLAVMEIPGCLVALYLVSKMRHSGVMDENGTMPGEPGYDPISGKVQEVKHHGQSQQIFSKKVLHEIFFNPGLYLLFGGIVIGYISRLQGVHVTEANDKFFVVLFQGVLCLFLLEMGMTACSRLKDLKLGGKGFIAFGLIAPNVFATFGILVAHGYSMFLGQPFEVGTYVLFAVLSGAASYIAVPAVQRIAIPEASPTLPLAASLGLTFTYNVTIGIPVYIMLTTAVIAGMPVN
ncbi:MAG TPA: sodium-dependent bicarbonate transport family permease [Nitrosomonas sp.]|uniref:sodium-dependent bicarbonate transport family permease n=1 Tax=Nitrosomonas sp. TaxID=42353 RepID=UPI000E9453F4|nr:sodium-dependent bicarbonate transport family permease [Nitrosomonas sp.]GJL75199.1 MAG: sodium-dependent bicarbonate transport family permease [Nitrosomonas sp.]HBV21201.1 sodium-dependent bicarbonate transport family permease [Nitrosomonas sp.]HNP26610.1 sodium-dependent bicarbonate transport family permease [Nitrosomonas sp.]